MPKNHESPGGKQRGSTQHERKTKPNALESHAGGQRRCVLVVPQPEQEHEASPRPCCRLPTLLACTLRPLAPRHPLARQSASMRAPLRTAPPAPPPPPSRPRARCAHSKEDVQYEFEKYGKVCLRRSRRAWVACCGRLGGARAGGGLLPRTPHARLPPRQVRDVYLPQDYYTRMPRGFAFVEFDDERDA